MIKHVLLIAILEEMERFEKKLEVLFESRPDEWQEIYTATRRQIQLCMTELVKLAQDDLCMSAADGEQLRKVFERFRVLVKEHQEGWPVESIDLGDRLCVQSFQNVRKASSEFKDFMRSLIARYRVSMDEFT